MSINQIAGFVLAIVALAVVVKACWPKEESEVMREPLKTNNLAKLSPIDPAELEE